MAQGYATLANGGHAVKPYVIDAIYGPDGETLYRADPAIVCDACVAERTRSPAINRGSADELTLEEMAEVATVYQPDASDAPELFENINVAPAGDHRRKTHSWSRT